MKAVTNALPHASIILSLMLIIFVILDRFNPSMGYFDNRGALTLVIVSAVTSIVNAFLLITRQRRL